MKNLFLAIVAIASTSALAQSSGSVKVQGNVAPSVSMKFAKYTRVFAPLTGAQETSTQTVDDAAMNFVYDFGQIDQAAGIFQSVTVDIRLRSNKPYKLSATVADANVLTDPTDPLSPQAAQALARSEIGFALVNVAGTGTKARVHGGAAREFNSGAAGSPVTSDPLDSNIHGDRVVTPFKNTPLANAKDADTDGVAEFTSTLANIAPGAELLSGTAISNGGGVKDLNNAIDVSAEFSILPQLYNAAGSFGYQVDFVAMTL